MLKIRLFALAALAAVLASLPTIASATVFLTYSDLLPNVSISISGFETGGTEINQTTNAFTNPIGASEAGLSVGAGLFVKNGLYPDPQVEASLSPFLPTGYAEARFGVDGEVDYYFSVHALYLAAPQPTFIPVDIGGKFIGEATNHIDAGVYVYGGYSEPIASITQSQDSPPSYGFDLVVDALPYNVYEVRLIVSGAACVARAPNEVCAETASSVFGTYRSGIDPTVTVDPSVANSGNYVLSFSQGLAPAIPEPPAWAMMLLGCAGLGFAGYRNERKAAKTFAMAE